MSPSELGDRLIVTRATVTGVVDSLERRGYVRRLPNPNDRRGVIVELTPEGAVFLAECRRVLAAADRASLRVQAAARGEAGTLRMVYTAASAYETVPALLTRMDERFPLLKVDAREVFGSDVADLVRDGACDLALAPMSTYPGELRQQIICDVRQPGPDVAEVRIAEPLPQG